MKMKLNLIEWIKFIPSFKTRENLINIAYKRWGRTAKVGDEITTDKVVKKYLNEKELGEYQKLDKFVEKMQEKRFDKNLSKVV